MLPGDEESSEKKSETGRWKALLSSILLTPSTWGPKVDSNDFIVN
jgi:hypothetical protein